MRSVLDRSSFTPFGLWIRQHLRQEGLSVANLDYVIEDFNRHRIMLVEEKQNNGRLWPAQRMTFAVMDLALATWARLSDYQYWGFYVVAFAKGVDCPGIKGNQTINGQNVSVDDLAAHLNFDRRIVDPLPLRDECALTSDLRAFFETWRR